MLENMMIHHHLPLLCCDPVKYLELIAVVQCHLFIAVTKLFC